jgi:hypothetical protein
MFARTTPIVAGRILRQAPRQTREESLKFVIEPSYFYFTTGLVALYCISLPFTRIPPPYCAPHWPATALDLYPYVYHSHLAQHYEFVTRHPLDKESRLNAQVLVTRRQYNFGLYRCEGSRPHIGISPSEYSSREGGRHRPVDKVDVKRGWLRFVYKFWCPPNIERIPRENDRLPEYSDQTPLLPRLGSGPRLSDVQASNTIPHTGAQLRESCTDGRCSVHFSTSTDGHTRKFLFNSAEDPDASSTGTVQPRQRPEDIGTTLTHRNTWTDHRDLDYSSEVSPLRLSQYSTWPRLQHKENGI